MEKKIKVKFREYYNRSKKKNITFHLTYKCFSMLCKRNCYYCGLEPKEKPNGIDRYYPNKGYTVGNVVPCCWDCNRAKSNKDPDEFDDYIAKFTKEEPRYIKIERMQRDWMFED